MALIEEQANQVVIEFEQGETGLSAAAIAAVETLATTVTEYAEYARQLNRTPRVVVIGHSDQSGSDAVNRLLEAARAEAVLAALVQRSIPPVWITAQSALETRADAQRAAIASVNLDSVQSPAIGARN
jgi:outer membrane protein OmpA-like peptidoglycan-associated protein